LARNRIEAMQTTRDTRASADCQCGAIGITLSGAPSLQAICACRNCRARTGSAFGLSAYYDRSQVEQTRGVPTVYRSLSAKGRALDFRFCPTCGTSVWWEAEFLPDKIGVAGGLLEGHDFKPDGAYFCASKPDWVHFDEAIPTGRGPTTGS